MNDLISTSWLNEELQKGEYEYVIIDARFNLMDTKAGQQAYSEGHIPRAVYVDLDKDMSSLPSKHGGRHPLPDSNEFAEKLGQIGIGNDTRVVVYDDQKGVFASRFWWMLKHLGHTEVAVLDGGYSKWIKDGLETTTDVYVYERKTFQIKDNDEWQTVDAGQVKEKMNQPETILIDSRDPKRYLGIEEPMEAIAGHIPGAVNHFWMNVHNKDRLWKDTEELKKTFSDIPHGKEIIVYCGSGVSACPNILSLKKAGYSNVRLYVGSWSDWVTHENYPIETETR